MIKPIIFTGALLLASAVTGEAMAVCSGPQVTDLTNPTLAAILTNKTICQAAGVDETYGAQEEHHADLTLWDYKRGPLSTIDPPTQIGNWSVSGTGTGTVVNYTYLGGSGSGSYNVFDTNSDGSSYELCNTGAHVATVTVVATGNGCPGFTHGAP